MLIGSTLTNTTESTLQVNTRHRRPAAASDPRRRRPLQVAQQIRAPLARGHSHDHQQLRASLRAGSENIPRISPVNHHDQTRIKSSHRTATTATAGRRNPATPPSAGTTTLPHPP